MGVIEEAKLLAPWGKKILWVNRLASQNLEHSTWNITSPDVATKRVLMRGPRR